MYAWSLEINDKGNTRVKDQVKRKLNHFTILSVARPSVSHKITGYHPSS